MKHLLQIPVLMGVSNVKLVRKLPSTFEKKRNS